MARYQCIVLIVAFILTFENWRVSAYPHGAPKEACPTMRPQHPFPEQDPATLPYYLDISVAQIEGGQQLTVNLLKTSPNAPPFEGFMIKAAPASAVATDYIGQFTTHDTGLVRYVDCFNYSQSAITHVSNVSKDSVTAQWRAPYYNGSVIFVASVVYNFTTFWVQFQSSPVAVSYEGPFVPSSTTPVPTITFDYSVCGVTRSCYGYPFQCVAAQDCMIIVSYYASGTDLYANIVGNTPGYVAFGLSTSNHMNGSSILECMITGKSNASVNVVHDNYIAIDDPSYFTLHAINYNGGILDCVVSRPAQTTVVAVESSMGSVTTDLTANSYYLLLSLGYLTDDQTSLIYHEYRQASTVAVDLLSSTYVIVD